MAKTYGRTVNAEELTQFLEYSLNQNSRLAAQGRRGTPICVWGTHGIGKTESIISFAERNNYSVVYCAPAQFEEMGDLHGIPETFDPTPESPNSGDEFTVYRPPEWLKAAIQNVDSEKPGLFILDDFNRADERILQGCMQLLQMHALFSWSLHYNWQIVLTANPEGGDYKVTEMDDAMLTRMIHVTMAFDAKCWAQWAVEAQIDPRGVDFVLTYPEVVTGLRTTARSLTQFFLQIGGIDDLTSDMNLWLVQLLGDGTLEPETTKKFLHFIKKERGKIVQPEEILEAKDFKKVGELLKKLISGRGVKRNDILATICTRLQLHVLRSDYKFKALHKKNMIDFLLFSEMDASLRFAIHGTLANAGAGAEAKKLIKDSRLAQAVLGSL
jgi:MoxR-like ATPase